MSRLPSVLSLPLTAFLLLITLTGCVTELTDVPIDPPADAGPGGGNENDLNGDGCVDSDPNPCLNCTASECCSAALTCLDEPNCLELDSCLNNCNGDLTCGQGCETAYQSGRSPLYALINCQETFCSSPCGFN